MKTKQKISTKNILAVALAITVLLGYAVQNIIVSTAKAATIAELRQRSTELQNEISNNKSTLKDLRAQADSLQGKIDGLAVEIANANREIQLTTVKLEELTLQLQKTEAELERQKGLLKASLRALYEKRGASSVELLIASESFSDFISNQEYLDRLQNSVKESALEVVQLKQQIQEEKQQQEDLKRQQEEQRNVLNSKHAEQQSLLSQTRGEEARYQAMLQQQRKELSNAEAQLTKLLSAGKFVSQGPVSRGQQIGAVGSTGYSTGAHMHFMVKRGGETVNPSNGGTNLINGYLWPVPAYSYVSTPYGYVPCQEYTGCYPAGSSYSVFHSGLDMAAPYYSKVLAAADGQIVFRGCSSGLGFVVVVDHGGGWQTWYPHMVTPSGQTSGYCG
ncbi:MAG: peptidoglycan DD-metalloendopeptidase family protein [bacterium]|nr:peptidoglycan DD-metalloendopeptidase family protein [bacterium]